MAHSHLVAIGDLYVDTVVDLAQARPPVHFADVTSSSNSFACWSLQVGGAALQTARAARTAGFAAATCIGALGASGNKPDANAKLVVDTAAEWGIALAVALMPDAETGEVLVAYDAMGQRLMISKQGANSLLSPALIEPPMRVAMADADVVHVSGYTLLHEARWDAVRSLLSSASPGSTLVAVDLTPHNIDGLVPVDTLLAHLTEITDCLMVDLALLRRLARAAVTPGPESAPPLSDERALAWGLATFPRLVVQPSPSEAVLGAHGRVIGRREFAYQPGVASRGQSAAVQAELLAAMVSR